MANKQITKTMKRYLLITLLICVAFLFGSSGAWADSYEVLYGILQTDNTVLPQTDFTGDDNEQTDVTFSDANGANCAAAMPIGGSVLFANTTSGWTKNFEEPITAGKVYFSGNYTVSANNSQTFKIVTSTGYVVYASSQQTTNGNANQVVAYICGTEVSSWVRQARKCAYGVKSLVIDLDEGVITYELVASSGNNSYTTLTGTVNIPADVTDIKGLSVAKTSYGAYLDNVVLYAQKSDVTKYDYTVNYMFGENVIKTVSNKAVENASITAEMITTITEGEETTTYYTVDEEAPSMTISSTGTNVLNVNVRLPYTATLSITKKIDGNDVNEEIALSEPTTRSTYWEYGFPKYASYDGSYYLCDETEFFETGEFTDGQTINIIRNYSTKDPDIVSFIEAENGGVYPSTDTKYSGGKMAAVAAQNKQGRGLSFGVIPAGNYKLTASVIGNEGRGIILRKKTEDNDAATKYVEIYSKGTQTGTFELEEDTELVLGGKDSGDKSNQSADFDYAFISDAGEKHTYTVKGVSADGAINQEIAKGEGYSKGGSVYAGYPRYLEKDGTLYEAKANNSEFRTSFTLEKDQNIEITYTKTSIDNVVFLSEGENIEGAIATSAGNNMATRSSNAACGYIENDVTLLNLPASNYIATMVCYSNSSGGATQTFDFGEAENYNAAITGASNWTSFTKEFSLESAKDIKWISSDASNKNGLDFIYIQDRGEYHRYTVRGKIEELEVYEEIADGNGYANDPAITIPVKKYIEKLGTLYEAQPIDDNYSITFTLGQNVDEVISYTKTTITNVTMFEECEDFTVEGNWAVRGMGNGNNVTYSQDMIGRLAKNSYAYSSPAYEETNYRVTIKGRNQAGSSAGTLELKLRDAEGNLSATIEDLTWKAGENKELTSGVISIPVGSSVVFFNNSADYNSNIEMDYVYFQDRGGKISYKLNAVDKDGKLLQNLSEGYSFENEPIQVVTGYNKYVNVEGTLYEAKPNTDKAYLTEFYLTKDTVVNIVYEPTEINNVVYLSEAEGIANASSYDKANANVRCLNGKGAFFENDHSATSLTLGNYRIVVQVYGGDPEDDTKDWTFTISVGNDTIWSQRTTGSLTEHCDTFTIIEPADVIVNKGGKGVNGKDVALLDYIYIQNLGDENKFQLKAVSEDGAIDSLLATRTGYASDEAKYAYYPKYLEVNDTLYEAQPNEDGTYRVLYTTTANNTQTISYTKTDIGEVVFLTEAEAIEGVTAVEEKTCSDGKGAYAAEAVALTSLEAGYYKMAGALRGAEGTEFAVTVGNDTIWAAVTIADETAFAETEFELTEASTLTIAAAGGEDALMAYFYIQVAVTHVQPEP